LALLCCRQGFCQIQAIAGGQIICPSTGDRPIIHKHIKEKRAESLDMQIRVEESLKEKDFICILRPQRGPGLAAWPVSVNTLAQSREGFGTFRKICPSWSKHHPFPGHPEAGN
jgi:hypothetical protein